MRTSERVVDCRSDAGRLWAALADTDGFNRAVGLEPLAFEPLADATAARYLVRTRLGGFAVEYEEQPYEWVYPERFAVERRMRAGPLSSLAIAWRLEERAGAGTRVTVRLRLEARYGALAPLLGVVGAATLQRFAQAVRAIDEGLVRDGCPPRPPPRSTANATALAHAVARLGERVPAAFATRLGDFIRDAPDPSVARIRPFELAEQWGAEGEAVLAACLAAVPAGLLELRWDVVCPSCRGAAGVFPTLAELSEHVSCHLCDIRFAADLDEIVEATFTPSRAVRRIDDGLYCLGGPARTPHVLAQALLPAHGEARLAMPREPGRYRLFARGGAARPVAIEPGSAPEVRTDAVAATEPLCVAPGGTLAVTNPAGAACHVKLERLDWVNRGARASVVLAMPAFRRDFSTEILRPGTALKVGRVALLFSDLTGSTGLYASIGDAGAYRLIHDHFELLEAVIAERDGILVKTLGDAVMASFPDELAAVAAALAMLERFEGFRATSAAHGATALKLAIHGGPCYAVTTSGRLDYFGQTVNIAARLQAEASGGELLVTEELAERALAAGALTGAAVTERYAARLKGVPGELPVARIRRCEEGATKGPTA